MEQFIEKYLGVKCGNTKENFGECVGLVMLWIAELGLSHIWADAKDIFANASVNEWIKIKNSSELYPIEGDVIVWNGRTGGGFGHTGVVTESDPEDDSFTVLEQNNPLGSVPIITKYFKWTNVIGWLRPKEAKVDRNLEVELEETVRKLEESENTLIDVRVSRDKWKGKYNELQGDITDLKDDLKESNLARERLAKEVEYLNGIKEGLEAENKTLKGDLGQANEDLKIGQTQIENYFNQIQDLEDKLSSKLHEVTFVDLLKAKWNNFLKK